MVIVLAVLVVGFWPMMNVVFAALFIGFEALLCNHKGFFLTYPLWSSGNFPLF